MPLALPKGAPLILLSPAKTLNFDVALPPALAAATPTHCRFLPRVSELVDATAALSRAQLKSTMRLSDTLAALNHERFRTFDEQPARVALAAFEGAAYKGIDAPSLDVDAVSYLQGTLRILCGLYGVLRPLDEIRPYRLEMSTRLQVGSAPHLYAFWGASLTESLEAELRGGAQHTPSFVLNVASQEYAKAVDLKPGGGLSVPVVTAVFPGPAVHAKTARGAMVRFCALHRVCSPAQLHGFTGNSGEWRFVPAQSTDLSLVFHRSEGAAKSASKSEAKPAAKPAAAKPAIAKPAAKPTGGKRRGQAAPEEAGPAAEEAAAAEFAAAKDEPPAPAALKRPRRAAASK